MATIRDVPLQIGGRRIGLYKLCAALKPGACDGKKAWESAVKRNSRRSAPLGLPVLSTGRVLGNHMPTSVIETSDVPKALLILLTEKEACDFYGSTDKVQALGDLVEKAGGQRTDLSEAALSVLDAAKKLEDQALALSNGDDMARFRLQMFDGVIYGSIIDYLNYRLKLDGSHVWTDWLEEDFVSWTASRSLHEGSPQLTRRSVVDEAGEAIHDAILPDLICHKFDGEPRATPMTHHEGFSYVTRRCMGRSLVSDVLADEALGCFSRYKVGDPKLHEEIVENGKTASAVEKAFVLGTGNIQIQDFDTPSAEIVAEYWRLAVRERVSTLSRGEAAKRETVEAAEAAKRATILAEEAAKRVTIQAEEAAKRAAVDAKTATTEAEEAAKRKTIELAEKLKRTSAIALSKAEVAEIHLECSKKAAEQAEVVGARKRQTATDRAAENEARERELSSRKRLAEMSGEIPKRHRSEPAPLASAALPDPELASYRAAGVADGDVPKDKKQADAWYKRAFAIQLKNRPREWNNNTAKLYDYKACDIYGERVPLEMCAPPRREPVLT